MEDDLKRKDVLMAIELTRALRAREGISSERQRQLEARMAELHERLKETLHRLRWHEHAVSE